MRPCFDTDHLERRLGEWPYRGTTCCSKSDDDNVHWLVFLRHGYRSTFVCLNGLSEYPDANWGFTPTFNF